MPALFYPMIKVVLVEQVRIPAMDTSETPWLLEVIAGMVEQNENLERLVRREAKEEADITIQHCYYALSYLTSPPGVQLSVFMFISVKLMHPLSNPAVYMD